MVEHDVSKKCSASSEPGGQKQTCNYTWQALNEKQKAAQTKHKEMKYKNEMMLPNELRLLEGKCEDVECPASMGKHRDEHTAPGPPAIGPSEGQTDLIVALLLSLPMSRLSYSV
eukprot:Cvel_11645.t1-p1 / transcript=Cvel_11645.t1 / gene=Cvel_11645 / organism=Chromera_velia_CCMP2878 / gene_product=hypothetical protein / transcript_product=hypothetical protein / location=Cvel_scaffold737:68531-69727(+) / protein_length=113 / sequence_SO=supercontig / SO=protein_coding / is_pseudo=false